VREVVVTAQDEMHTDGGEMSDEMRAVANVVSGAPDRLRAQAVVKHYCFEAAHRALCDGAGEPCALSARDVAQVDGPSLGRSDTGNPHTRQ